MFSEYPRVWHVLEKGSYVLYQCKQQLQGDLQSHSSVN